MDEEAKVRWLAGHYAFGWGAAINLWRREMLPPAPPGVREAHLAGFDAGIEARRAADVAGQTWAREHIAAAEMR